MDDKLRLYDVKCIRILSGLLTNHGIRGFFIALLITCLVFLEPCNFGPFID